MNQKTGSFEYAPFIVEAGKIREFAKALGLKSRIYYDHEAAKQKGFRGIPAPPTFTTVIDFWNDRDFYLMFSEWLKLDPNQILHGEQEFEYLEEVVAGDIISAKIILTDQVSKGNMEFYHLETVYRNQFGHIVRIGKATLIERKGETV